MWFGRNHIYVCLVVKPMLSYQKPGDQNEMKVKFDDSSELTELRIKESEGSRGKPDSMND